MFKSKVMDERKIIEQYQFYMLADTDMNEAHSVLKIISRYKKRDVINALIRNVVVTYSKPFTTCKGISISNHKLDKNIFVPGSFHILHDKIMDYRNQIFAHTDLTVRKPKLGRFPTGTGNRYALSFRGFSPRDFENNLPRIEGLIHEVTENIHRKMRAIEKKLELIE